MFVVRCSMFDFCCVNPNIKNRISNIEIRIKPNIETQTSSIENQISNIETQTSNIETRKSNIEIKTPSPTPHTSEQLPQFADNSPMLKRLLEIIVNPFQRL